MEERAMRTLLPRGKERGNPTKVEEPLRGNAGVRYPSSLWPQRGSRTGPDAHPPTHTGAARAWATSTSSAQCLPYPRAACPTAQRIFLLLIGSFYLNVFFFFFTNEPSHHYQKQKMSVNNMCVCLYTHTHTHAHIKISSYVHVRRGRFLPQEGTRGTVFPAAKVIHGPPAKAAERRTGINSP